MTKYICKGCFKPCILEVSMDGFKPDACILSTVRNNKYFVTWTEVFEDAKNTEQVNQPDKAEVLE